MATVAAAPVASQWQITTAEYATWSLQDQVREKNDREKVLKEMETLGLIQSRL